MKIIFEVVRMEVWKNISVCIFTEYKIEVKKKNPKKIEVQHNTVRICLKKIILYEVDLRKFETWMFNYNGMFNLQTSGFQTLCSYQWESHQRKTEFIIVKYFIK